MILICYDGSEDAKAAVQRAGELLAGHPAIVLTIWAPVLEVLSHTSAGFGLTAGVGDVRGVDEAADRRAQRTAEQGADLARAAGLDATPRTRARSESVANAALLEADRTNASLIVLGSRGVTRMGSRLSSVSHAVLQHADRAVLVVTTAAVARRRADARAHSHAYARHAQAEAQHAQAAT